MEQGLPPSDQIEEEWTKTLRDELRRLKDLEVMQKVATFFSFYCFCLFTIIQGVLSLPYIGYHDTRIPLDIP